MAFLFLFLITKMNLHVKKNICNHGKCDWVKEAMVGEKPTTLMWFLKKKKKKTNTNVHSVTHKPHQLMLQGLLCFW